MIKLLNKGYVMYVEHWGSDKTIIESARMSTNRGFEGWEKDAKLLEFLYKNKHMTPFEMCGMTLEIKAPIMVFREWHRHRTQSYNEMSARYVPLPNEDYVPHIEDVYKRSKAGAASANRQAQGAKEASYADIEKWLGKLIEAQRVCQETYEFGLEVGIPKELARGSTTVFRYSRMRASCNLRNWLGFLDLRTAPNAQQEIRLYANAVEELLSMSFPKTHLLFKASHGG